VYRSLEDRAQVLSPDYALLLFSGQKHKQTCGIDMKHTIKIGVL
jgi:hypothetical protein